MKIEPHYNNHPSGIECITIIIWHLCCIANAMKYLWRAGLKGDTKRDIQKAIDYLNEHLKFTSKQRHLTDVVVIIDKHPSGVSCSEIVSAFPHEIAQAMSNIWTVGLGFTVYGESEKVVTAIECLKRYLKKLNNEL